jgi:hypothetical protein
LSPIARALLSDSGIPVEKISRLVGHKSTVVTEFVYRKQIPSGTAERGRGHGPDIRRRADLRVPGFPNADLGTNDGP